MNEIIPELGPKKIEKEQLVALYQKFITQGITNPDSLDLDDPEVKEANDLYFKWINQLDEEAKTDELKQRINFEKTMFYIDAGFTDPSYVEEILDDFAEQDIDNVEEKYPALALQMKAKVAEYRDKFLEGHE